MEPLVSILIPTCNRPAFFEQALKSAWQQTYQNTEIIICDNSDREQDQTERLARTYQEGSNGEKIRYVRNKKKLGPHANQQKCLELANGEYINYLMDDDLFHPQKIERMMAYFLNHEGITLVTSRRKVIDAAGRQLKVPKKYKTFKKLYPKDTIVDGMELGNLLLRHRINYIGEPTTVLFRKSALSEPFGMLAGYHALFAVDLASWLHLLSKGKAVYITKPLSYLRYHSDQLSQYSGTKILSRLDTKYIYKHAKSLGFLKEKEGGKK